MRFGASTIWAAAFAAIVGGGAWVASAAEPTPSTQPVTQTQLSVLSLPQGPLLLMQNADDSVYEAPTIPREDEGVNAGGVNFDLRFSYLTDYVYRGIKRSAPNGIDPAGAGGTSGNSPNLQFDGSMEFDLGKLPHPFVGVFANIFNDDPLTRFQEIRPFLGLELPLRPLTIAGGYNAYIFPDREDFNTSEVFVRVTLDDTRLFGGDRPLFSPYAYLAYDVDRYDGFYAEAGLKHDFVIEDTGITLTAVGDVAYVENRQFRALRGSASDSGFQHYDVGFIGSYSLNTLLNVPRRYGRWQVEGYLFYTDGISDRLRADTQLWGGVGFGFRY